MKHLQTFESFLNEGRVSFKGKTISDLYKVIKNKKSVMIFVNGSYYSIDDPNELKNDLESDLVYGYDKDGEEHELEVADIEFIEI